jgi:choline dehydrogenase-like flavoprotein
MPTRTDGGAGGNNTGLFWIPNNTDPVNVTRVSSRVGYYAPASHRSNLHLITGHYVGKIELAGRIARAVQIHERFGNNTASVTIRKEVILAAGAINTPKILQLSGLGPKSLLESLGIKVIEDLPGVGLNLQDHAYVLININCALPTFRVVNHLLMAAQGRTTRLLGRVS